MLEPVPGGESLEFYSLNGFLIEGLLRLFVLLLVGGYNLFGSSPQLLLELLCYA